LRSHENVLALAALAGAAPALAVALWLLFRAGLPDPIQILAIVGMAGSCLLAISYVRRAAAYPWRTMSSMIEAVRSGDYAVRARAGRAGDPVSEALTELNRLGDALRDRRLEALEVNSLLQTVLEQIDVALFAFDAGGRLQLVNPAGAQLLAEPAAALAGRGATELGLRPLLEAGASSVKECVLPGGAGRWRVRHSTFREAGRPLELLVLSDLTRELREEELLAWQRLVRVLGHELNNSLTPIQSIARSLDTLVRNEAPPPDWRDDLLQGLAVIASRSDALARFVSSYARLARLPAPERHRIELEPLLRNVLGVFPDGRVELLAGTNVVIDADRDQIEQALINLLQNALDATGTLDGRITLGWRTAGRWVEIRVNDMGPGLANPANLFVPFFTTRAGGSGVGLVLCRKIAEGHGGTVTLENRSPGPGCSACLRLPLA
jgi:nitrogen fixation/metabolism regulation signal transduction histidine kinase